MEFNSEQQVSMRLLVGNIHANLYNPKVTEYLMYYLQICRFIEYLVNTKQESFTWYTNQALTFQSIPIEKIIRCHMIARDNNLNGDEKYSMESFLELLNN